MQTRKLLVLPEDQFKHFDGDALEGSSEDTLRGHLLLKVGASGRAEDHFRVAFSGIQLQAEFQADQLSHLSDLTAFSFHLECSADSIIIKNNSFVSKWEDLETLVSSGRVQASKRGQPDADADFRAAWATAKTDGVPAGAAIRWAVQACTAYGFKLTLQGLPATARALRKDARLASDHTKGVELASWVALNDMATSGRCDGPSPILFAKDVAKTTSNLNAHLGRLEPGIETLYHSIPVSNGPIKDKQNKSSLNEGRINKDYFTTFRPRGAAETDPPVPQPGSGRGGRVRELSGIEPGDPPVRGGLERQAVRRDRAPAAGRGE